MLERKKKVLQAIIEWVDKTNEDINTWTFNKDSIIIPGFNVALQTWQLWRLSGQWPLGDWLEQPLSLLAKINAIDAVYHTWRELRHNSSQQERPRGLASMSATQLEIVRVFNN
jgi:predicted DCC family thiol-disulfide oxidoreductase YuxK